MKKTFYNISIILFSCFLFSGCEKGLNDSEENILSSTVEEPSDTIEDCEVFRTFTATINFKYNIISDTEAEVTGIVDGATNLFIPQIVNDNDKMYTITSIAEKAFYNCSQLSSIVIPYSVTKIGDYAFEECCGLTYAEIPGVKVIGKYAFYGCKNLENIMLPSSVTNIANSAFANCSSLTSIEIPSEVKTIGTETFKNCKSLENVSIPSGVTTIGVGAFFNCSSLKSLNLPSSVKNIGIGAFYGCDSISRFEIGQENQNYSSVDGVIYDKNKSEIIMVPGNINGNVEIPEGITSIPENCFSGCKNITAIKLPSSLNSIESMAFYGCLGLTEIEIPSNITSIGDAAFSGCKNLNVVIGKAKFYIAPNAFEDCKTVSYGNNKTPNNVIAIPLTR